MIIPTTKAKAERAVRLAFSRAGREATHLEIVIWTNLAPDCGQGQSTADATAATLAACQLRNMPMTLRQLALLVREAEGAADPLALLASGMTPVWLSRRGGTLAMIDRELPPATTLAFLAAAKAVSTTKLSDETVYTARDVQRFKRILDGAIAAIRAGDLDALGRHALRSIDLNQQFCETPHLDELRRLAKCVGASALTASHSGTAAAFHWMPDLEGLARRRRLATDGLTQLGAVDIHQLQRAQTLRLKDHN